MRKPASNVRGINNCTGQYKGALMDASFTLKHDPMDDYSGAVLHRTVFSSLHLSVNKRIKKIKTSLSCSRGHLH